MTSRTASRTGEAGLTLVEVMIAMAIMAIMLGLAWTAITDASEAKRGSEREQNRNHEVRMALARVVEDLQSAYLSKNEDETATHRRTLFIGKSGGTVPALRFSSLAHRVLWADANESDATAISYEAMADREDSSKTHWLRREQRRVSVQTPADESAEYDVLIRDVESVRFEYWDWKDEEWQDSWDTSSADGEKGRLPERVRITVKYTSSLGTDLEIVTQARLLLQEQLNFVQ